jgi:hypothetical protein
MPKLHTFPASITAAGKFMLETSKFAKFPEIKLTEFTMALSILLQVDVLSPIPGEISKNQDPSMESAEELNKLGTLLLEEISTNFPN